MDSFSFLTLCFLFFFGIEGCLGADCEVVAALPLLVLSGKILSASRSSTSS